MNQQHPCFLYCQQSQCYDIILTSFQFNPDCHFSPSLKKLSMCLIQNMPQSVTFVLDIHGIFKRTAFSFLRISCLGCCIPQRERLSTSLCKKFLKITHCQHCSVITLAQLKIVQVLKLTNFTGKSPYVTLNVVLMSMLSMILSLSSLKLQQSKKQCLCDIREKNLHFFLSRKKN